MVLLAAPWVEEVLAFPPELAEAQAFGLAFLLGSFAVATLSDLKRLSAQREFLEVWVLFTLGLLAYDVTVSGLDGWALWQAVTVKWVLITALGLMSWHKIGPLFRLARADVFACTAAAALLSPLLIVLFWLVLKVAALGLRPLLARGRAQWPFMPVVSLATVVVFALGFLEPNGLLLFG